MSSDLVWKLLKQSGNRYVVARRNGTYAVQFSTEPGNLNNLNRPGSSGLAPRQTVDVAALPRGVSLTLGLAKGSMVTRKVKSVKKTTKHTRGSRISAKAVTNVLKTFKPKAHKLALKRMSAILKSQVKKSSFKDAAASRLKLRHKRLQNAKKHAKAEQKAVA